MIDKTGIKERLLTLEATQLEASRHSYMSFLQSSTIDASEPCDEDQISQAEANAEIAEAFDTSFHSYAEAMRVVEGIDFGKKSVVEVGAAVQLSGHWFVVAVSTEPFEFQGTTFMGISRDSPVYQAAEGKQAGDQFDVKGRTWLVNEVA